VIRLATALLRKRDKISYARQNTCKCGSETFSYENGPKGNLLLFVGFRCDKVVYDKVVCDRAVCHNAVYE